MQRHHIPYGSRLLVLLPLNLPKTPPMHEAQCKYGLDQVLLANLSVNALATLIPFWCSCAIGKREHAHTSAFLGEAPYMKLSP